jgi:hypothetical protein
MKFINQHSFFIFAGLLSLAFMVFILRAGTTIPRLFLILVLLLVLVSIYMRYNPGSSSTNEIQQIQARIGNGKPVLLEFQSQY